MGIEKAIQKAIEIADKGDMVLILGKGNETYETLKDGKIYFNDIETAAMWCIKYSVKGVSPKNKNQVMKVEKNINKALNKNSKYCGVKWFYKGDDE